MQTDSNSTDSTGPAPNSGGNLTAEELTSIIRDIRERVRSRHPSGEVGSAGIPLADLMPLVHARDAAEAKVAAIGTVNPRPPGFLNNIVQGLKRIVARALDWHIREQVEFNRAAIEHMNAALEALNELNQAVSRLAGLEAAMKAEVREIKDIRSYWHQWRENWENQSSRTEIRFLRSLADLRAAYDLRVAQMETRLGESFRQTMDAQHQRFEGALERTSAEIQRKLWADLDQIRDEQDRVREHYERLIHNELRVVRQRAAARRYTESTEPPELAPRPAAPAFDYLRFADRFRGTEEYVKRNLPFYVDRFRSCASVLDLGCGRGEFLEALREAGIPGRGIDLGEEFINICRQKGLQAEQADLFEYLEALEDESVDGIFCCQVIEHLPPERLPDLVRLAAQKLHRRGVAAFETPNPECLAIFATHFYLDPTHTRPVPASLMVFYLEEAGFGGVEIRQFAPAVESIPALAELPAAFREEFFGGLDYGVVARRL